MNKTYEFVQTSIEIVMKLIQRYQLQALRE